MKNLLLSFMLLVSVASLRSLVFEIKPSPICPKYLYGKTLAPKTMACEIYNFNLKIK